MESNNPVKKILKKTAAGVFLAASISLLASCESILGHGREMPQSARERRAASKSRQEIEDIRARLVEAAHVYKGASRLDAGSRTFALDCSGVVAAIYYYAGIDLQAYYSDYTGTGTERIYKALKDRNLLHTSWQPEPGDIIFWDNTYDRNRNRKANDYLTHMGMVVSRDRHGNIVYVHHNYSRGIVFEHMNIRHKNVHTRIVRGETIIVNSPMRKKGSPSASAGTLSGELFRVFGSGVYLD